MVVGNDGDSARFLTRAAGKNFPSHFLREYGSNFRSQDFEIHPAQFGFYLKHSIFVYIKFRMSLRCCLISKFIALLLLLEVAIPVYAACIYSVGSVKDGTQVCSNNYQNLFSPLLLEELNENEEERDGFKANHARPDFSWFELSVFDFDIYHGGVSYSRSTLNFCNTPALFRLHCKLLI